MARVFYSKSFLKDYKKTSIITQKIINEKLKLFTANPHHPSLMTKKMEGTKDVWEARITKNYRFTFQVGANGFLILRRVGAHDILKKE